MRITKILYKKYANIFSFVKLDQADKLAPCLLKVYVTFLGNCRFELEDFDLHKGRYF